MRSHISARPAITKYLSNLFVFKTKIEKEGLPRDDTPDLGAGGLRFKSGRPDQNTSPNRDILPSSSGNRATVNNVISPADKRASV